MNDSLYNTKLGIMSMVTTLDGLNRLQSLRHEAGYDRKERLNEFVILGRWFTDSCGNFGKIIDKFIPAEEIADIPPVLTREEFWALVSRRDLADVSLVNQMNSDIPPVEIRCGFCGDPWSIRDCHNVVVTHETQVLPLSELVGSPLSLVRDVYAKRSDANYFMYGELVVCNDHYIDLSPNPEYPSLSVNSAGWVRRSKGPDWNYVVQKGDKGYFNVWTYYHTGCYKAWLEKQEREYFSQIFEAAGFRVRSLQTIPNQRNTRDELARPWFEVDTSLGQIAIGWRKRVISIDWSDTGRDLSYLFSESSRTYGAKYVHAGSGEEAILFLKRIREALS
jgi:hypothetical protein